MIVPQNETEEAKTFLLKSNDIYRLLLDSVEDFAIFLLDTNGNMASWNRGAERMMGYKPEEAMGRHHSIFYTPDSLEKHLPEKSLQEALIQGRMAEENWRIRQDGSVFWAKEIITPIHRENQVLIGFSKLTRDLTERKKAEDDLYNAFESLKESEARYRLLIEGVGDYAIFMLDPAGNVSTWNEGARRIKGYEAEEIIGRHFSRFYTQKDVQDHFPDYELDEARRHGRFEDLGWRLRKDGSAFWANVVITAIYNSGGKLLGFSKITRDLTERKRLEEQLYRTNEELKETEERSRLLVESVKDYAILMLSPSGEIISWNEGAERIKGYQAKDIIGKNFSIFYTRDAIAKGFPQYELEKALKDGRFEDEGWRIRKDGSAFWANVIITPIITARGHHLGFSKITRDLTEKRRNEELMKKNQELGRINRDLDNFVYTASHDLKSPILNLEGLITELKVALGGEQEKYNDLLPWIDDTIINLKKVVNDLAEVTRVVEDEAGMEEVSFEKLLGEVKDSLRDYIIRHKANIQADFSGAPSINYSRKNLRSVLYNLVSNAIKYASPDREPVVKVRTSYIQAGKVIKLVVSDNGLGIPANQKDKIFTMFRRVHTHVEGSGIGLYLVKKILENQGDFIEVSSEPGVGSTFTVFFKKD